MKIVVLAGGLSPERDVSLSSGSLIANALIQNGHEVICWDVYQGIDDDVSVDSLYKDASSSEAYAFAVPEREPDLERIKRESNNGSSLIGKNVDRLCKSADLVFMGLHGSIGENGQLQAMLDLIGVRYTGTGYAGSLLAMDKECAKFMMKANSIQSPQWAVIDLAAGMGTGQETECVKEIDFPCVVKPCSCGSSVGVTIVNNTDEYEKAIEYARKYENRILVEKYVRGREFSVGILDNKALPVIEIIPKTGFYDYKNKYQKGASEEICPADLTPELTDEVQNIALNVHRILRLGYYSRIDFILSGSNEFYCLEANTLPGMTPTSLLPQEALAVGIRYNELCERLAQAALAVK